MLPLIFLYCCPSPCHCLCSSVKETNTPGTNEVLLAPGPQEPESRHKKQKGGLWHCPVRVFRSFHRLDPGCRAESLLCHSWQMAWLQYPILSTTPPCRAPLAASSHLCFKRQWRSSHFLSDRLGKISLSSSFYFYPKNKHKTQTKNQSVRNSHEFTLWSFTKPSAMLSIPIWLS